MDPGLVWYAQSTRRRWFRGCSLRPSWRRSCVGSAHEHPAVAVYVCTCVSMHVHLHRMYLCMQASFSCHHGPQLLPFPAWSTASCTSASSCRPKASGPLRGFFSMCVTALNVHQCVHFFSSNISSRCARFFKGGDGRDGSMAEAYWGHARATGEGAPPLCVWINADSSVSHVLVFSGIAAHAARRRMHLPRPVRTRL